MKLCLQICLLALCLAAAYAKYKTKDFTDKERWDAMLQGVAHADKYIQNMEKKAAVQEDAKKSPQFLLKNFFRKASAKSVAMGKARIKMEKAVKHAERILLEKKRLETAAVASREEMAEVIAQELYHKPGSILSKKELVHIYQTTDCEELRPEVECSTVPFYHSIRTITGVCNNLQHPTQGSSFTEFLRLVPPQYSNGIDTLFNQADEPDLGAFYPPSPSARLISDTAVLDRQINDSVLTHLIMQWGQFMDHDLDLAVEFPEQECDLENCLQDEICAPVRVPGDDEVFGEGTTNDGACHAFQRTLPACVENPLDFTPREQVNELTHYIDGSMVYGSTQSRADFLREFEGGLLRVSDGDNLPLQPQCAPSENPLGEVEEGSNDGADCCPREFTECGVAGDVRALEHVSLTVMHTVWVREHNRIARGLAIVNPQWDDSRLYFEARDIVIAQIQQITFSEYLPALYGDENFKKLIGDYPGYNPEVDASVPNSFATAAYRFGHSQIQPTFERLGQNGESIDAGPLNLVDSFMNPPEFFNGGGVPPMVQGWVRQPARLVDEFLNSVLTTQLFETSAGNGMDLVTLNIQRGRDHGLPRYGTWKRFCFDSFGLQSEFRNELTAIRLRKLYGTEENIDLFVGALAEEPIPGSALGAVSTCIFTLTFGRLRSGDRFWHENPDPNLDIFTPDQLDEIQKTSFARVLCDNGGLARVQESVFFLDEFDLDTVDCSDIPGIDFALWIEETFCFYRATVIADDPTVFTFFNRPTGTGNTDLRDFQLETEDGEEVSRCVPFRCPGPTTARSDRRDIIATVPRGRRFSCRIGTSGRRRSFSTTVTQQILESNTALFDNEEACEASNEVLVNFRCDGLEKKMASTADLENELAKVLQETAKKQDTPTKLEVSAPPNPNVYDDEDVDLLNSTEDLPEDDLPTSGTKTAKVAKSHKANTARKTNDDDKLIDLLQATLEELKHSGK